MKTNRSNAIFLRVPVSDSQSTLQTLCTKHTIPYIRGCGYYEFAKKEKISGGKKLVACKGANWIFGSDSVREELELGSGSIKISPSAMKDGWILFVNSTSANRKLKKDTHILLEVSKTVSEQHAGFCIAACMNSRDAVAGVLGDHVSDIVHSYLSTTITENAPLLMRDTYWGAMEDGAKPPQKDVETVIFKWETNTGGVVPPEIHEFWTVCGGLGAEPSFEMWGASTSLECSNHSLVYEEEDDAEEEDEETLPFDKTKVICFGGIGFGCDGYTTTYIIADKTSSHFGKIWAKHADGGFGFSKLSLENYLKVVIEKMKEAGCGKDRKFSEEILEDVDDLEAWEWLEDLGIDVA